jgi:hypothetical protein
MAQLPAKPEATQKPKPNPQQPKQPDETPNKPKGRENADDQTGPEPPPIGDIDSNPVVVEPLFTGAERKRRKVRVYNREEEEGDNRKESAPAKPPTIKSQPDTPIRFSRKSQLRGGDRQLVKRYFERVRSRHRKSGDGR